MTRTLGIIDADIVKTQALLDTLDEERRAFVLFNHVFTADDFRIRIESDPGHFTFDDIVGDCGDEAEKNDPESWYSRMYEAYHNGDGIEAWCVVLEGRDPVTDDWNMTDSCGGFFSVPGNGPDHALINNMLNCAADWLPQGVNIADVSVEFE